MLCHFFLAFSFKAFKTHLRCDVCVCCDEFTNLYMNCVDSVEKDVAFGRVACWETVPAAFLSYCFHRTAVTVVHDVVIHGLPFHLCWTSVEYALFRGGVVSVLLVLFFLCFFLLLFLFYQPSLFIYHMLMECFRFDTSRALRNLRQFEVMQELSSSMCFEPGTFFFKH